METSPLYTRIEAPAVNAVAAASAVFFVLFLFVAFSSLTYPFPMEWMEGAMVDNIQRVLDGKPLYTKPSLEFVSFPYPPLFYYLGALTSQFFGIGFAAARFVSVLSAIGIATLLFLWGRRQTGSAAYGLLAIGLFFATYPLSGRWLDIARVDSLFFVLSLWALYGLRFWHERANSLVAVLMLLAILTKQTAALIFAPVLLAMLLTQPKRAISIGAQCAVLVAASLWILNEQSDGWFSFFAFELQKAHALASQHIYRFWQVEIIEAVPVIAALSLIGLHQLYRHSKEQCIFYSGLLVGLLGCSYLARLNWGSYLNVLIPAYAGLCLLSAIALAQLRGKLVFYPCLLAVAASLAQAAYAPSTFIPPESAYRTGEQFVEQLKQIEGDVLMPEWQFVQTYTGKRSYTLGMAAFDLFETDMGEHNHVRQELFDELGMAVASGRFSALMPGGLIPLPGIDLHYQPGGSFVFPEEMTTGATNFLRKQIFLPKSGQTTEPPTDN